MCVCVCFMHSAMRMFSGCLRNAYVCECHHETHHWELITHLALQAVQDALGGWEKAPGQPDKPYKVSELSIHRIY